MTGSLAPLAELFFNYGYPAYVEYFVSFPPGSCITLSLQYSGHPDVESAPFQPWKREDQSESSFWLLSLCYLTRNEDDRPIHEAHCQRQLL